MVASPFETRASRAPQGEATPTSGGFPHPEEGRRPVSKDEEIHVVPYAIALVRAAEGHLRVDGTLPKLTRTAASEGTPMTRKRNPLNLNTLQLKTLTLLQELARDPEHATPRGEEGSVMVSQLPIPHGDHFHVGAYLVLARDASGLANPAVFTALERKGLIRSLYPMGAVLTPDALAYETGMAEVIFRGSHH